MQTIQESQNKGAVFISYFMGNLKEQKKGEGFSQSTKLILMLSLNIAGFHFCMDDPTQLIFHKLAFSPMPPQIRANTKPHFGSHVECQYLLASYGIPREALPFSSSDNGIDLSNHKHWAKQCAHRERNEMNPCQSERGASNYDCFQAKTMFCVLERKSSTGGNERLMKMATSFADSYDDGTVKSKFDDGIICNQKFQWTCNARLFSSRRIIINCMIAEIRKHGGRFLKPDTSAQGQGGWIEVKEKEMREKIGQTFRNLRRRRAA